MNQIKTKGELLAAKKIFWESRNETLSLDEVLSRSYRSVSSAMAAGDLFDATIGANKPKNNDNHTGYKIQEEVDDEPWILGLDD